MKGRRPIFSSYSGPGRVNKPRMERRVPDSPSVPAIAIVGNGAAPGYSGVSRLRMLAYSQSRPSGLGRCAGLIEVVTPSPILERFAKLLALDVLVCVMDVELLGVRLGLIRCNAIFGTSPRDCG